MTPVYLTGIDLSEFRSFAELHVALAAEPGVLIVHGSNGLGKSSLFDALEWTLTGEIDHFRAASGYKNVGKYLRRWDANSGPTSAALTFSDGGRIERQIASARSKDSSVSGSVNDIVHFLRAPEWTQPISTLDRYLMLTHFLGQSTLSRLTHRPADERFAVLKEASQSAELEAFGVALHGSGANAAARAFNKRIDQLDREAADLQSLLDQEAALWQASQQAGALDDAQSSDLAQAIISILDRAWQHLGAESARSTPSTAVSLEVLQNEIERVQERARQRDLELNQARALCDQRDRFTATRAEAQAAATEAEKAVNLASAATQNSKKEAAQRRVHLTVALADLTSARRTYTALMELQQSIVALRDIRSQLEVAAVAQSSARQALEKSEQKLQSMERRAQLISRFTGEISDIERRLDADRETISRAQHWLELYRSIAAAQIEVDQLEAEYPAIDKDVTSAERRVLEARAVADLQAAGLAAAQASFNVLTNAVTAIAGNLPDDLCECPVCATKFADARALSIRAASAAERLSPLLLEKQEADRQARLEVDRVSESLQQNEAIRARVHALKTQSETEVAHSRQLMENIGWSEPHTSDAIIARVSQHEQSLITLSHARSRRQRWVVRLAPDRDRLVRAHRSALKQRDDALRADNAARRRFDDLAVEQEAKSHAVDTRSSTLFLTFETIGPSDIEGTLIQASGVLKRAEETHDQALSRAAEQDAKLASLQSTEASMRANLTQWTERRDAAESSLAGQGTQWKSIGWTEVGLQQAELDTAVQEAVMARDAIREAAEKLQRLRDGSEAWTRQLTHRSAFERLRSILDLAPNTGRDRATQVGQDKVKQMVENATATRRSKEIALFSSADIAREVEEFNAEYIEPLGKLTKQINQAILCDPRIGIELHVNKKKIEQSASRAGELPPTLGKIDPMLVHSEGQMAALAVSMLCAASLTYPWSRWRALVLDDPLQHNDAIHASAFADLMGNLVTAKQYQILLSTHDLAQSEFLQRKFDARQIPCAVLNLLGRGKGGVEWSFRETKPRSQPSAASA